MKGLLLIAAAVCGYAVAGINPAIVISRAVYRKDIRECGSGNPGFTNFRRVFGWKWAWLVLVSDLSKAAVVVGLFAWLLSLQGVEPPFGAAYTGMFCMLGHAFPVQFRFRGGKGFLVCLSTVYVIDWRVGLTATAVMLLLLLTTRYMSLATTLAMLSCPILLIPFGASVPVILMTAACAVFMAARHKENYKRLFRGTEPKFALTHKNTAGSGR